MAHAAAGGRARRDALDSVVDEIIDIAQCIEKYGCSYDPINPTSYLPDPAEAAASDEEGPEDDAVDDEPEDKPAMMAAWSAWVVKTQHFLVAKHQQQVTSRCKLPSSMPSHNAQLSESPLVCSTGSSCTRFVNAFDSG